MAITFKSLQDEVKRRATWNQSGTTFDTAVKNIINFSIFRIARDAPWRNMRRKTTFSTVTSYTKGTGLASVTSGSNIVSITGANLINDGVIIGRKIKLSASSTYYYINTITSATTLTIDQTYNNASTTTSEYEILPQEEYVLPIQAGHRMFMWHEGFGYPFQMNYTTDPDFYHHGVYLITKYPPTHYRMWGTDMAFTQVRQPSVITVSSSSSLDTAVAVTIFGTVSNYPDYEVIMTNSSNGTTTVSGTKIFSSVERIVKGVSTTGRITCTANSGGDTVAVLPVGDTTSGPLYRKIQLYPLPNIVIPIHLQYYKDPYALVNDGDVHELGEEFNEAIILLSTAKIKAETNLAESDRFTILWQDEMRSLKRTNVDKMDFYPRMQRPNQSSSDALVSANLLYRQVGGSGTYGPSSRL